jgi:AraC-like DNA-binding protein
VNPRHPPFKGTSLSGQDLGVTDCKKNGSQRHEETVAVGLHFGASSTLCSERTVVNSLPTDKLTSIEKDVVAKIRALRTSPGSDPLSALLESPARLAHHFISVSHGNVQLRFRTLAEELGVEKRTLERTFAAEYQRSMMQFQVEARLAFSQQLLSEVPPTKISAIAATLGYDLVRDFNRFFKQHTSQSPSEWSRRKRERISHETKRTSLD